MSDAEYESAAEVQHEWHVQADVFGVNMSTKKTMDLWTMDVGEISYEKTCGFSDV